MSKHFSDETYYGFYYVSFKFFVFLVSMLLKKLVWKEIGRPETLPPWFLSLCYIHILRTKDILESRETCGK